MANWISRVAQTCPVHPSLPTPFLQPPLEPDIVVGAATSLSSLAVEAQLLAVMENFGKALAAALTLGFFSMVFVLRWVLRYREGLSWEGGAALFNWHPVLIVSGFIFLTGLAITIYRLPWTGKANYETMKYIHGALHTMAFTYASFAMMAAFGSQSAADFPNMFSLHSWLGLTTFSSFGLLLLVSACIFLLPFTPLSWKTACMPIHGFVGRFLFGSTITVALTGITEKLIFGLSDPKYTDSPSEALFANVMGMLLVGYGAAILWISTRPAWKRTSEFTLPGGVEDKVK
ncbi:cytochrome b reductase 1-like [Xyrichtys novacula]|uniref:Plasma membrane ascorbate-dependent reductase CYBRD1 n=1 Tax=Xyrichtys novacula TaxID=13765 RepID=A0AAV1GIU1_XYRNO|nr:cytochrome b reductase 1-like [Xyrichtys novacula]